MNRSTLIEIARLLRYEGFDATESAIEAVLAPLCNKTVADPAKYDLQPGEVYVLNDRDDRYRSEDYSSRASLEAALQDFAEECFDDRRDFDDRVIVFIKRCTVPVSAASKVTVSLG